MVGESKWRCGGGYCGTVIWKLGLGFGWVGGVLAGWVRTLWGSSGPLGWAARVGLSKAVELRKLSEKKNNWAILAFNNIQAVSEPQLTSCALQQHSSVKADRCSARQEIPRNVWNPKVHYRVQNSRPLAPILSQMNPFHVLVIHLVLSCCLCLDVLSGLYIRFPHQNSQCIYFLPHTWCMSVPLHPP